MTLELLKAGLQKLIDDGQFIDESKKAIAEIEEVQLLAEPDDIFKGECYVLHSTTVSGLLNIATYDAYGKLYVEHNGDVSRSDYEAVIRRMYECDCLPNSAVELGYDIISDLYSDNKALGCHNSDGTYNDSYYEFSTDLSKLFNESGLKILYEAIQEPQRKLLDITEKDPQVEPATGHLAVLSRLHAMLEERI